MLFSCNILIPKNKDFVVEPSFIYVINLQGGWFSEVNASNFCSEVSADQVCLHVFLNCHFLDIRTSQMKRHNRPLERNLKGNRCSRDVNLH